MHPSAVRAPAPWLAFVALGLALWGLRATAHEAQPVVIKVDRTTTYQQFLERRQALLGEGCSFVWGDVLELPGARPGAIAWAEDRLDGWFVCGRDVDRVINDRRLNSFMMVTYADGRLWASHPSGDERWPLDIPSEPSEERWGVLAAVIAAERPGERVLPVFRAVRWLPRVAQVSLLL